MSGGSTTSYSYDANSNRTTAGSTAFTYNRADQLVSQTVASVTRSFTYDAAGNQTSSPVSPTTNSSFTYDAANQPLTVSVPGQPLVTYTYDALGRRATRTASGATETYQYVGDMIARIDRGSGNVTDSAIDAMGDRLTVGGVWTIPTVRGDVAGLLNAGQSAVTDAYRYDPFGVSLDTQGSLPQPSTVFPWPKESVAASHRRGSGRCLPTPISIAQHCSVASAGTTARSRSHSSAGWLRISWIREIETSRANLDTGSIPSMAEGNSDERTASTTVRDSQPLVATPHLPVGRRCPWSVQRANWLDVSADVRSRSSNSQPAAREDLRSRLAQG